MPKNIAKTICKTQNFGDLPAWSVFDSSWITELIHWINSISAT